MFNLRKLNSADQAQVLKSSPQVNIETVHLAKLDVVRGFAILCVFFFHTLGPIFKTDRLSWSGLWLDFSSAPHPSFYVFYPLTFGWIGVPVFFVLSGFLIHYSYLKSDRFSIFAFYYKRVWRIYPSFIVALVFCTLFNWIQGVNPDPNQIMTHILMIYNFDDRYIGGINGSFWSLAVEFQLYLIYPILLLLRRKFGIRKSLIIILAISLSLNFCILISSYEFGRPSSSVETNFPLLLWFGWALGCYLAEAYSTGRKVFNLSNLSISLFTLVLLLFSTFRPASSLVFYYSPAIVAIFLEKYIWSSRKISSLEKLLIPLGLCSYSFYLWHFPLIYPMSRIFISIGVSNNPWIQMLFVMPIIFGFIFGLSWILYITVEKRSQSYGRDLWNRMLSKDIVQ